MKDFLKFSKFEIKFTFLLVMLALIGALCSCHTAKKSVETSTAVIDSAVTESVKQSEQTDVKREDSLTFSLEDLDVWVYDFPKGSEAAVADSVNQKMPVAPKATGGRAIHLKAKKAGVSKNGKEEQQTTAFMDAETSSASHSEAATSSQAESDSTGVASPPGEKTYRNLICVLLLLAVSLIAAAYMAFRRRPSDWLH